MFTVDGGAIRAIVVIIVIIVIIVFDSRSVRSRSVQSASSRSSFSSTCSRSARRRPRLQLRRPRRFGHRQRYVIIVSVRNVYTLAADNVVVVVVCLGLRVVGRC